MYWGVVVSCTSSRRSSQNSQTSVPKHISAESTAASDAPSTARVVPQESAQVEKQQQFRTRSACTGASVDRLFEHEADDSTDTYETTHKEHSK